MDKNNFKLSMYYDPDPQSPNQNNPLPRWSIEIIINKHYKVKDSLIILTFCYTNINAAEKCKTLSNDILEEFFGKIVNSTSKVTTVELANEIESLYPKKIDHVAIRYL
ncbi:MAG: hypothetical protein H6Q72_3251 [Firmicutes bacterium]|nr:hypothetical protein [Bacillota bacterium]